MAEFCSGSRTVACCIQGCFRDGRKGKYFFSPWGGVTIRESETKYPTKANYRERIGRKVSDLTLASQGSGIAGQIYFYPPSLLP